MANEKGCQMCPKEWYEYSNLGDKLDIFVPFKAPLPQDTNYDHEERFDFSWDHLFSVLQDRSVTIGLVIDLTQTSFYDKSILLSRGIEYCRLYCSEENELPDEYVYELFANRVDKFLGMQNRPSHIGVHCLTGVNQTGFLICKYLICNYGWSPTLAIEKFAAARGHPIQLQLYLDHLVLLDKRRNQTERCSDGEKMAEMKQHVVAGRSSNEGKRENRSSRNSSHDSRKSSNVKDSPRAVETKESPVRCSPTSRKSENLRPAAPIKEASENYVLTRHWSLFGGSSVSKVFVGTETKDMDQNSHGDQSMQRDNRENSVHNGYYRSEHKNEEAERVSPAVVKTSQSLSDRYRNNDDARRKSSTETQMKKNLREENFKREKSFDSRRLSDRIKDGDSKHDSRSHRNNSRSKDHISSGNGSSAYNRKEPASLSNKKKELGELSKEEAKKYDSCRKDRGTKKEFAEKRTRTSRERYRSPESPRSSKSSNMKVKSRRDSLLDVSSERSTSAEKRRERKERSAKRERDYAEKKKSSRSKSPYRNRNWRRSQSRDKMSSPGRRKRDSSGSRKDRCKKRNWKELSNGSDDRWRSGSKDASSRRTQKEKDKKKMKLMEAKEEEMSTKNFMRGLLDQIQNNQLVTDKVPVSDDKVNCTEVEKEDVKTSDESKEGVTKQLDLEAYKSRILGGMAGGDEDTSESPTKSESVPRDSESLQPSYNAVQSLSICQSFPKFSTFESNPSEGSKHVNQNITDGSTSSNVAVASDASSVKSTENAQLLQSNPTRMRAPTYRPRYTPETQLISKALRFYAPQLGGVRPNLDPRPAASSNISNPPPFARSRQPAAVPTARLQVNQQSQNVPANMRPHAAMLGQRNNYPMPMIRNIHSMQRTSAAMGMSFAPRPMGHRNANMGMTPARPIAAHGRCYAPFNPARGSAPFRTAANPIRHLMPPSNYSSPMNPNSSEHHSPAQSFIDDDTGPMNSFSEPRRLNLQTF